MKVSAKLSSAIVAAILFFIISNPIVYKFVDGVLGGVLGPLASTAGCPTATGLILHSAVFGAVMFYGIGL